MKTRMSFLFLFLLSISLIAKVSLFPTIDLQPTATITAQHKTTESYKSLWHKVDSLQNIGQPKTALKVVEVLYKKAKQEKNSPQFLKTVMVKMRLKSQYEENSLVKSVDYLKKEIRLSGGAQKSILQSALAEQYYRYYSQNRWKINQRSATINFDKKDMETWATQDLINTIIKTYQASLSNPKQLQKVSLKKYSLILREGKNSKKYRPTLYDFLSHRSLIFFSNTIAGITHPADQFIMNKDEYLAPWDEFVKLNIETTDSMSSDFYGIKLLQDLLKFHAGDSDPTALVDADLIRLQYVKNRTANPYKDSLYLQTLIDLQQKYSANPVSALVMWKIAQDYEKNGNSYNWLYPGKHQWDKKTAVEYCQSAIDKFPKSEGGKNCKTLISEINKKEISVITEYANLSNNPFLVFVNYQNIPQIYLRIIKIDPDKYKSLRKLSKKKIIQKLYGMKTVKEWSVDLKDQGDYQKHGMEIKIPALPLGFYVILIDQNKEYNLAKSIALQTTFWITNLSYITSQKSNYNYDFYMLDRQSGQPIQGVVANCYTNYYDYNKRQYITELLGKFRSDAKGYFHVPNYSKNKSNSLHFSFKKGDDTFISRELFSQYGNRKSKSQHSIKTFFFTDRAIYRPGQTIYFKGIMLDRFHDTTTILPQRASIITLYDHNYTKVKELKVVTNEYGSFNGSFTVPKNGITGEMRIFSKTGSISFSVEEYKRPKFEVEIMPVKGSYKLGQKLTVKGKATAFAGYPVDGAKVKYRIVRSTHFPYWGYSWRWQRPSSPNVEIENGTIETDVNGEFEVEFTALADKTINKNTLPVFNYIVYADVTDLNGETHSTQKTISVGSRALILKVKIPKYINQSKKPDFTITTTNLNGEFTPTKGQVTIYRLKTPTRIFKTKKWRQADRFSMTKEEYYKSFPNNAYANEDKMHNWEQLRWGYSYSFDTGKDKKLDLDKILGLESGSFVLIIRAQDVFGAWVEQKSYFTTFSAEAKTITKNTVDWFRPLKTNAEPGEKVPFLVGTQASNQRVLFQVEFKGKVVEEQWISLNKEQKMFSIPVKEKYRGDFFYHLAFVKNNRFYSHRQRISVPFTNKKLDISFETFRNKLQPGEKEEWRIKIKGKDGDKVAAEMLVTMYDASLDAFRANNWYLNLYSVNRTGFYWSSGVFTTDHDGYYSYGYARYLYHRYDKLNWFGYNAYGYYRRNEMMVSEKSSMEIVENDVDIDMEDEMVEGDGEPVTVGGVAKAEEGTYKWKTLTNANGQGAIADSVSMDKKAPPPPSPKIRTNFNETAFFLPDLHTDAEGNIIIKFTAPESLTRWKIMGLAHTKDLKYGQIIKELVTQKDLMVVPNAPRFFREGDHILFSAKVSNISKEDLEGNAKLLLFDALTMKPVDALVNQSSLEKSFSTKAGNSSLVTWSLVIPQGIEAITYRITAQAGNFSDGEEMAVPVLTNRMLVTESLPLPIRGFQTKKFTFSKLVNSTSSSTLKNHRLTLEFTSHPAWYAVQALPYLMEFPYECSEQTFSRYYANSIAQHIMNSSPKIKAVFEKWKNTNSEALMSNLEKNQELKSLLLEETPWVLQAKNETERKKRIGLLFDLNKMANQLKVAEQKLSQNQLPDGSWPWFKGGYGSRYITQHIVTGFGHLDHLGIYEIKRITEVRKMLRKAVGYLDNQIRRDYDYLLKYNSKNMNKLQLSNSQIQYLYARSYFIKDFGMRSKNRVAFDYYYKQAKKYWLSQSNYMQGMIALALHRYGETTIPHLIIKSLKENSLYSEEMGMYWKTTSGWYWYQAPIETQALMIEAFEEVANDSAAVEDMKVWLLKQKQTQDWKTTKATTDACYALLLRGSNLLASDKLVEVQLGDQVIDANSLKPDEVEAGTGYFKKAWDGEEIKPEMGNITVTKKDAGVAWGAIYWQYFEQLDKITMAKTPLAIDKKLFVERITASGPVIEPVSDTTTLKVGDKIKVRIELRVDRAMDYVHMKDMRASALEPTNVISRYKWQDGLGYYQSTRDAATNFFFDHLRKGTYVFEYKLFVTHKGNFSNGITTIQCMYAPEFTSHSEGVRIIVK